MKYTIGILQEMFPHFFADSKAFGDRRRKILRNKYLTIFHVVPSMFPSVFNNGVTEFYSVYEITEEKLVPIDRVGTWDEAKEVIRKHDLGLLPR